MTIELLPPTLTPAELFDITGKRQPAAQHRHLRRFGIRAERRADGSVMVLREWLNAPRVPVPKPRPMRKSVRNSMQG